MVCRAFVLMAFALFICANPGAAQIREPIPQGRTLIPDAARPTAGFDVERATRAYLDSIPAEQRAWLRVSRDAVVDLSEAGSLAAGGNVVLRSPKREVKGNDGDAMVQGTPRRGRGRHERAVAMKS
jgi:hypothetical protein